MISRLGEMIKVSVYLWHMTLQVTDPFSVLLYKQGMTLHMKCTSSTNYRVNPKVSCREQHPVQHPCLDYPGPDILVFTAPPRPGSGATATNTVTVVSGKLKCLTKSGQVVMSNGELEWSKPETCAAMLDR